jgi:polysaccharide export outer membrane protein
MKPVLIVIFVLLFVSISSVYSGDEYRLEYKIGPKDLLEISVFGLEKLNQTVRVSETGKITLPLLGEVEVEGLTQSELERKLSELLEEYLRDPRVTVFIREYQSKKVSVLGAVGKPGHYELLGRQTLLQIIAQAGSLTPEAGDEIIVMRENGSNSDNSDCLRISVEDLFVKGNADLNIPLFPNDIITIPQEREVTIYIHGRVKKPGAFQVKTSDIPTLQRAIAYAGGFAEGASKGGVILKRIDKKGKETIKKINVKDIIKGKKKDIQLKANDVIYVPEKIF